MAVLKAFVARAGMLYEFNRRLLRHDRYDTQLKHALELSGFVFAHPVLRETTRRLDGEFAAMIQKAGVRIFNLYLSRFVCKSCQANRLLS